MIVGRLPCTQLTSILYVLLSSPEVIGYEPPPKIKTKAKAKTATKTIDNN